MTSTIVSGVWRSHAVLDESEPDCSPEAAQQFKKMRSSSSLNSLRMSLRKRLPLKPVQSNVNISETPTWESLQMNQKTSAVHKMARSAKNSIGSVYQVCFVFFESECRFIQSFVVVIHLRQVFKNIYFYLLIRGFKGAHSHVRSV